MAGKCTEAQKKATSKYLKTLASISIRVKKEEAEYFKKAAESHGMSLREFILVSMKEKIEKFENEKQ